MENIKENMHVDIGALACFLLPKQAQAHAQERKDWL